MNEWLALRVIYKLSYVYTSNAVWWRYRLICWWSSAHRRFFGRNVWADKYVRLSTPDRPTDWRCCVGLLVGDNEDILCTLYCCVLNALNSQQHILHKLLPVLKLYIKDRTEEDIFELVNVLRSIQLIRNEVTRMTDWMTRIKSTWSITPTSNDAGHGIESGPNSELHSEFFKV